MSKKLSAQQTEKEVDQLVAKQVDEIVATPTKKRIWEVDFLRGFMMLFVMWDHTMWDVNSLGSGDYNTKFFQWLYDLSCTYYAGSLRAVTHDVFVTMFVLTAGVSCAFSHSNGKRALKMVAFATLLTAVTYVASSVLGVNVTINFNVIHVIALSVLIWTGIEWVWNKCKSSWQKNLFGGVMTAVVLVSLTVGAIALYSPSTSNNKLWFFLIEHHGGDFAHFYGGDYLPFLPDFGWFLVGAFLGKWLYKEGVTLFPSVNTKTVAPVTFVGRYSLWFYFGSQAIVAGLVQLLHVTMDVL